MWVLLIYVVLMIIGDVIDVGIGARCLEHVGRRDQPADLPRLLLRHAGHRLGDGGEDRGIAEADDLSRVDRLQLSRVIALSCQRRSTRCVSHDSSAKITIPVSDNSSSAANIRGMLSR